MGRSYRSTSTANARGFATFRFRSVIFSRYQIFVSEYTVPRLMCQRRGITVALGALSLVAAERELQLQVRPLVIGRNFRRRRGLARRSCQGLHRLHDPIGVQPLIADL